MDQRSDALNAPSWMPQRDPGFASPDRRDVAAAHLILQVTGVVAKPKTVAVRPGHESDGLPSSSLACRCSFCSWAFRSSWFCWRPRSSGSCSAAIPFTPCIRRMFGNLDYFPAARRAAVHLRRRYHVARRHCATADRAHSVAGRRGTRLARHRHHRRLRSSSASCPARASACVAAIGKLTIPALKKNGYGDTVFSVSLVTATGVIDIITPPSITMIIYRGCGAAARCRTCSWPGFRPAS